MAKKKKQTKESIDKKEEKARRISTAIANMEIGETTNPTRLAKSIEIHPDTLRDVLDLFDSLKEIGFRTLRDGQGKIISILRTDESMNVRNDILDVKKQLIGMDSKVRNLDTWLRKSKK